jgi:hypothetical protein
MQKSSSPKKSIKRVTTTETVRVQRSSYADQFFEARSNADLQIELQNKALEIQSIETSLISLNLKLEVKNDL